MAASQALRFEWIWPALKDGRLEAVPREGQLRRSVHPTQTLQMLESMLFALPEFADLLPGRDAPSTGTQLIAERMWLVARGPQLVPGAPHFTDRAASPVSVAPLQSLLG